MVPLPWCLRLEYLHLDILCVAAMDVTKPYKFIGFGAMDVTKPYKFMGFGAMEVTKPF